MQLHSRDLTFSMSMRITNVRRSQLMSGRRSARVSKRDSETDHSRVVRQGRRVPGSGKYWSSQSPPSTCDAIRHYTVHTKQLHVSMHG